MNRNEIEEILSNITCLDYNFLVDAMGGGFYIQAYYYEPCTQTGKEEIQKTRKWYVSSHATKSEIVQTVLKAVITSMEHRAREWFLYKGERVYGPHFDVEALVEIAKARRLDEREDFKREPDPWDGEHPEDYRHRLNWEHKRDGCFN